MTTILIKILINWLYFHGEIISGTIFLTYLTLGSISYTVWLNCFQLFFYFHFTEIIFLCINFTANFFLLL